MSIVSTSENKSKNCRRRNFYFQFDYLMVVEFKDHLRLLIKITKITSNKCFSVRCFRFFFSTGTNSSRKAVCTVLLVEANKLIVHFYYAIIYCRLPW